VARGSAERIVPVLMTALTAGLALLPLIWAGNKPGHEIEYPLAVILGGLTTSTVLNLLLLPPLYLRFGRSPTSAQEG
jgi:Cu/Ag efflux pump CusA